MTLLVELAALPNDGGGAADDRVSGGGGDQAAGEPAAVPGEGAEGDRDRRGDAGSDRRGAGGDAAAGRGKVPVRTLVYAGLGDEAERNLTSKTRIYQLYRRLFMLLGPNAFNRLGAGGLPVEVQALHRGGPDGRQVPDAGRLSLVPVRGEHREGEAGAGRGPGAAVSAAGSATATR